MNKYAKSVEARRAEEAAKIAREGDKKFREKMERSLQIEKERANEAVWKAEFAYEVLRAILPDLRKGERVSWARLSKASDRLEHLPGDIRGFLLRQDFLDREDQKVTPKKKEGDL